MQNGNVNAGKPTGLNIAARVPCKNTVTIAPKTPQPKAATEGGANIPPPTAVNVNAGLKPYKPLNRILPSTPKAMPVQRPTADPSAHVNAARGEQIAMPSKIKTALTLLPAKNISHTPCSAAVRKPITFCMSQAPSALERKHVFKFSGATGSRGLKSVVNDANARVPPKNHMMAKLNGRVNAGVGIHFARAFMIKELKMPNRMQKIAVCKISFASSECACSSNVPIPRPTKMALKPYRPSVWELNPSNPRASSSIAVVVPDSKDNTP